MLSEPERWTPATHRDGGNSAIAGAGPPCSMSTVRIRPGDPGAPRDASVETPDLLYLPGGVSMEGIWIELVLISVGVLANGFFAGSEIALVSSRVSRLVQLRDDGVRGAAIALHLKESPESFLATIQIAITMVGTLASAVGGATAIEALTPWLADLGVPGLDRWAGPVALGMVILAITYVSLVVGELVPKAVALRNPERLACAVARPIAAIGRRSAWVVKALTTSTNLVLRSLGLGKAEASPFVSEEEVRYLVSEGASKGVFETVEAELVHNVFEFADATVRDVLVPRAEIRGLDIETPSADLVRRAAAIGHSRIPVYRGSIDEPVGIVTLKDIVLNSAEDEPRLLAELMRPPIFIPEFTRVSSLLKEFQRTREYLAFVVDEYGSVQGLVSLEDVLEEIVGDIREPGEPAPPPYASRLPDGAYLIDGTAPVRELRDGLGLPIEDRSDYTTLAGFLLFKLESIPRPGASLTFGGHVWTVVDMNGPKIEKVKVSRAEG
jgi:putative hemolysin